MSIQKTLPKMAVGVYQSMHSKALLLCFESEKHCLKEDELGKVTIGISYQKSPQMGLTNVTSY
jgi:hypothetical protein